MGDTLKLRDLLGVREVEAALHVPGRQLLKHFDDLDQRIEALSRRLFGVADADTYLSFEPRDFLPSFFGSTPVLNDAARQREEEWAENFHFLQWDWEEEREAWLEEGWDVSETNGERLACMRCFGRPLVCVVDQLMPQATLSLSAEDRGVSADQWGRSIENAAKLFLAKRRR